MPGAWKSLDAWRYAHELFVEIHKLSKAFPADERFVLTSQLRRAALSVPTNIVEGTARFNTGERVHFLRTAWASLAEVEYLVFVALELSSVGSIDADRLQSGIARCGSALRGLIATISAKMPRR
jgi:four helix bundle protein